MKLSDPRIHRHDLAPWLEPPETAQARLSGDVAHQALEFLPAWDGDPSVPDRVARQAHAFHGVAAAPEDIARLSAKLRALLEHPDTARFFAPEATVLTEATIVRPRSGRNPGEESYAEQRVDRLVILPDGALWVLDYKSGAGHGEDEGHAAQVTGYARLLAEIFGRTCHPALIYLDGPRFKPLPAQVPPAGKKREQPVRPTPAAPVCAPRPPIRAVAYRRDILADLAATLLAEQYDPADPLRLARTLTVFPHRRPRVYLFKHLASSVGGPFLAPRALSLTDWLTRTYFASDLAHGLDLGDLDQAWVLFQAVSGLDRQGGQSGTARFGAGLDWERFLPWGLRLASILDELDREGREAEDIVIPPDGLPPLAADILANLGAIRAAFREHLAAEGRSTRGSRLSALAGLAGLDGQVLDIPACTIFCGFTALTGNENRILHGLWERGARFWWQAEAPLPSFHAKWLDSWGADLETVPAPEGAAGPEISFTRAHDLHSELRGLAGHIREVPPDEDAAVILPEPGHLIPLLACLPDELNGAVNITLGYPLGRTALAELLNAAARLAAPRNPAHPAHRCEDFLAVWHNPWVRRVLPAGVRALLRRQLSAKNRSFLFAEDLAGLDAAVAAEFGREDNAYFALSALFLGESQTLRTLRELAGFLRRLMAILQPGSLTVSNVENEFAYALQSRTLPRLELAECGGRDLSTPVLWRLFLRLLESERAAFAGHPLTSRQVMGLLESRLLVFDNVFVLDLNEGVLPLAHSPDPLLPEELRPVLGLPPSHTAEEITRHHLRRLILGAAKVRLFCQAGDSGSALTGKKTPSRFFEELLWEKEKRAGRVLADSIEDVPFQVGMDSARPPLPTKEAVRGSLDEILANGLSPSSLNAYLACPLRFYFRSVARIRPPYRPDDDTSARVMGDIAHKTLEILFKPHLDGRFVPASLLPGLDAAFARAYAEITTETPLRPEDGCFGGRLIHAALRAYLEEQAEPVRILALESRFARPLDLPGYAGRVTINGRADRIDLDPLGHRVILDYKSGRTSLTRSLDLAALEEMSRDAAGAGPDRDGLDLLRERIRDIQLPCYIYLADGPAEAAYVRLTQAEKQRLPLWAPGKDGGEIEDFFAWSREELPGVLQAVVRHMIQAPEFLPASDAKECGRCDFAYACPWRES